jgi:hypothetical protein
MSIVASYTREQWEALGGWRYVDEFNDGVSLLFREEDDPEQDVLPVCIRIDSATGKPWPEDENIELRDVPYRYYKRVWGNQWVLEAEGEDKTPHSRIRLPRPNPLLQPTAAITKDALLLLGFQQIHMNPNYNGGYFKLIKDLPTPVETCVYVTFGDHYCLRDGLPAIVWFSIGET